MAQGNNKEESPVTPAIHQAPDKIVIDIQSAKRKQSKETLDANHSTNDSGCTKPKLPLKKHGASLICPLCFVSQKTRPTLEKHLREKHDQTLQCERFLLDSFEGKWEILF